MKALADELDLLAEHYSRRAKEEDIPREEQLICLGRAYAYANAARRIREQEEKNAPRP